MVGIKFKNESYIETIQNTESYKRSKQAIEQWVYWRNKRLLNNERYWKQNPDKFLEEFYGLHLLPYQKLLLKLWSLEDKKIMQKGFEKRFNKGDIVYWCHHDGHGKYSVHWGMVDEQFSDAVMIDYLEPRERRLIDGVPIDQFESEERFRKLPKGWSYDTKLFEITYSDYTEEEKNFRFSYDNPKKIKEAYDKGWLVKSENIFHGQIEADITKDGFRIRKTYPMWKHHTNYVSIRPDRVYFTWDEAKKIVDESIVEFMRQTELSDYEWSVEKIDETLAHYKNLTGASDEEVKQYRDWLLAMKKVEDIETRLCGGEIQWRYWKNKRWKNIEL